MDESLAPGDASSADLEALNDIQVSVAQIELREAEEAGSSEGEETADELILEKIADQPYTVFVLNEFGRPIYASCGFEEQLCATFGLISVFVERVRCWEDELLEVESGNMHIRFSHRKPLILCVVSATSHQLDVQLDALFEQILSTLSRPQLETIYQKRGDTFDLRRLLKGTDKYMDGCVSTFPYDACQFLSAIRPYPLPPTEREQLAAAIAASMHAAKLDGVIFGVVIAHRQVAAIARYKNYTLHEADARILVNLVSHNASLRNGETWTPICLPHFNDTGFLHAHISYLWEGGAACLLLLSVNRDHFFALSKVKEDIAAKLASNGKSYAALQAAMERPRSFNIGQVAGCEQLWHFVYKNKSTQQMCTATARRPVVSREERRSVLRTSAHMAHLMDKKSDVRMVFARRSGDVLLVWVTDKFCLQCVFDPLVSASAATACVERLLKALKQHDQRYFIMHAASWNKAIR